MSKALVLLLFFLGSLFSSFSLRASEEAQSLLDVEKQLSLSQDEQILLNIEKDQLTQQIDEIQSKIKTKKILILKRLKALYSLKYFKWGELLMNNSLNSLDRNINILKKLNNYDYELFKEYNFSLRQLALARKNLQETALQIQKNVETLKIQQGQLVLFEKQRILLLQSENKKSLLTYKGRIARPLEGQIKQEFGTVRDQDNQFYLINRGDLYLVKMQTPVKSVGLGTIIFRDELTHWRETLIVQHADNYYSVYAGVKDLKKSVGERVDENELLGATAGESFYFELRHFDNPINPKNWYKSANWKKESEKGAINSEKR